MEGRAKVFFGKAPVNDVVTAHDTTSRSHAVVVVGTLATHGLPPLHHANAAAGAAATATPQVPPIYPYLGLYVSLSSPYLRHCRHPVGAPFLAPLVFV